MATAGDLEPASCTSGSVVNVEIEPKSTFAAPLAASPWARAAPSRAGPPYPPPPALGSRPASSAGFSCWAARQQELDLRYVQRVVTAPLWLHSFGARDGNDPRHLLHRVGVLGTWRAPLPGDLSRLSEPRHCERPELKISSHRPQRGFHKQRLHFNRHTPCMSTSVPIEAQPLAVACWPSAV